MAKSAAQRMREMRARQKMRDEERDEERAARLTAFTLNMPFYQREAAVLERLKRASGVDENADALARALNFLNTFDDQTLRDGMKDP